MGSLNYREAVQYLLRSTSNPKRYKPLLLKGSTGIGKSSVPKTVKAMLEAQGKRVLIVDLRLALCDAGDIKGLPAQGNGFSYYEKPEWYPAAPAAVDKLRARLEALGKVLAEREEYDVIILFFDELNRAPRETQQAVFQIILDRILDDMPLADNVVVMSAINADSSLFQVTTMDPALVDRFYVTEFAPEDSEWFNHLESLEGMGLCHPAIRAFVEKNPQMIESSSEDLSRSSEEVRKTFSKRSWTEAGGMLLLEEEFDGEVTTWPVGQLSRFMSGVVGDSAATLFARFVESDYVTLSPKEILNNYSNKIADRVRRARPDELAAVVDQVCKLMKDCKDERDVRQNVFRFMVDLPDEIAKKLSTSLQVVYEGGNILAFMKDKTLSPVQRTVDRGNGPQVKVYKIPLDRLSEIHTQGV